MKLTRQINLFIRFCIFVSLTLLIAPVWASGDSVTQSNDMNNQTTGDVSTALNTGGNDALGIGFSSPSFGAAISQCLATKSENWAFGAWGKQGVTLNYHCMGLAYMQFGMIDAGVHMLCNPEKGPLSGMDDCESAVKQFNRGLPPPVDPKVSEQQRQADEATYHEEQLAEQAVLYEDLQSKVRNLESDYELTLNTPPQVIREIIEVQQAYLISAELADELRVVKQ